MRAQPALQVRTCDPFAAAREQFEDVVAYLASEVAQRMTHSDMERQLQERGRELLQRAYQGWLDQQAPAEAERQVVDTDGLERTRKREA